MVSDRWIPVLAATVGVLGGVGGALIGGLIANEGQQDQLESERDAAREALRQEAYAGYLAAANTLFLTGQIADRDAALDQDEVSEEEVTSAIDAAFKAQAAVEVVAPAELRTAARELTNLMGNNKEEWAKLSEDEWKAINDQREWLIDLVQEDLGIETGA
jgi:hypothetical protein